jgi:hypothetical protein
VTGVEPRQQRPPGPSLERDALRVRRHVHDVLRSAVLQPAVRLAGHGDEPVETQAFIAAGHGVTVAHELNVLIHPRQIVSLPIADTAPNRRVQVAVARDQRSPVVRAVVDVLGDIGARREPCEPRR